MNIAGFPNQCLIIGLTGNIGTGKSSIRKMLEHLGALGIDADIVARDALSKGSSVYNAITMAFGVKEISNPSGEIDRKKLGEIVFSDPAALEKLESLTHPYVSNAIKNIISHSPLPIIVIEAIKLLESDLADLCHSIWVVDTQPEIVYERLAFSRGMNRTEVELRLAQQSTAAEKIRRADVVIQNSSTSQAAWKQVFSAFRAITLPLKISGRTPNPPSHGNILLPSNENRAQLQALLRAHPGSLAYQALSVEAARQQTERPTANWTEDTEWIFQILTRFFFEQSDDYLAFWDMNHFNCRLGGYILRPRHTTRKIKEMVTRMEKFGELHLCSSYSIPIKKEDASFTLDMGYDKQQEQTLIGNFYQKAGYNLYTKINPLPFKSF